MNRCFTVLLFISLASGNEEIVTLKDGSPVVGKKVLIENGVLVTHFLSIPFAAPPVGSKRFMAPVPAEPWTEPRNMSGLPSYCVQKVPAFLPKLLSEMSEDCLYLNIYKPATAGPDRLVPVMVFIHGGSFQFSSSSEQTTNGYMIAATQDIILVNLNYRLGIFGFLYMDNGALPGNQGLWDQLLALKWINTNIASFGGDPTKVTLAGHSAGGYSVSFHILSPYSKSLFRTAILESGVGLNNRSTRNEIIQEEYGLKVSDTLGCKKDYAHTYVECLQKLDPVALLEASLDIRINDSLGLIFIPVVDHDFIPDDPINLLKSGSFSQIDILLGFNANEGWLFIPSAWPQFAELSGNLAKKDCIQSDEMFKIGVSHVLPVSVKNGTLESELIAHEYSRWHTVPPTPNQRADALDRLVGDYAFVCPSLQFANFLTDTNKVYIYRYSHKNAGDAFPHWMGAVHGAELRFVFGTPFLDKPEFSNEERDLSSKIMSFFGAFVRTGSPIDENNQADGPWLPYIQSAPHYMKLDIAARQPGPDVYPTSDLRCDFWNELLPKLKSKKLSLSFNDRDTADEHSTGRCTKDSC